MRRLVVLLVTLATSSLFAGAPDSPPLTSSLLAGVALGTVSSVTTDARFVPSLGAELAYRASPTYGFFVDLKLQSRGFRATGQSASVTFLDVPFGLTVDTGPATFLVGPMLFLPLGDYAGPLLLTFGNQSKHDVGIYLAGEQTYELSSGYALGYRFWFARGFTGIVPGQPKGFSPFELGLALVVRR